MIRGLYTSATGMTAQQMTIDVISNNLANINTTGFKKSRAEFQDLMYQYLMDPGAPTSDSTKSPSGIGVGLGVKAVGTQRMFSQGDLVSTSNPLDVAIQGTGFFAVTLPDGTTGYTRSGNFQRRNDGTVVTAEGYEVQGAGSIPDNATSISISEDGQISYLLPGTQAATVAGTIEAVRFANNAGLKAMGGSIYVETESSGAPVSGNFGADGFGRLAQGFLESSNVSVVGEVVQMITAQRAYEAASKGINTSDEMLSQAINLKR